ncbi:hypothetical protein PS3A_05200 [Pseudomonas sp. 3A(2025)]
MLEAGEETDPGFDRGGDDGRHRQRFGDRLWFWCHDRCDNRGGNNRNRRNDRNRLRLRNDDRLRLYDHRNNRCRRLNLYGRRYDCRCYGLDRHNNRLLGQCRRRRYLFSRDRR